MTKYVGSTANLINWDDVIHACQNCNGSKNTVQAVMDRSVTGETGPLIDSYNVIIDTWKAAGYNLSDIYWHDYYPGSHFDASARDMFASIVNAQPRRVWVSEVAPGRNAPYHWDVDDQEEEWLAKGKLRRWVCFIDKPCWGSILILEDECFHNIAQGEIWEWDDYKSYHAGTVMGADSQYLFHFLGTPND